MVAKYETELTALKAAWNTATYSRNTAPEYQGVQLFTKVEIMIDTDSYSHFDLRAPIAAHFAINSIDIPGTATLWLSSKSTAPTEPNNELNSINMDFAWETLGGGRAKGKKALLRLPNPITKSRTDATINDDPGTSPRADGKSIKINWITQHFPQIASNDYIAAFIAQNCSTRPTQLKINRKRAFIKQGVTLPTPADLKPASKQIEGRRGRKSSDV